MSNFNRIRAGLGRRNLILVGAAALAAYLGARAAHRGDISAISAQLTDIAEEIHKTNYWSIYNDVQRDLLAGKEED